MSIRWEHEGGNVEYQVLTFETEKRMSWRMIQCNILHYPTTGGICISGVLYYKPYRNETAIICFDVRSEKYSFARIMETSVRAAAYASTLINYKGKLGALLPEGSAGFITRATRRFEMWVLEDSEKHEWSKHIYELPMWKYVVPKSIMLYFVGVTTSTNEVVISSYRRESGPFYVFYYSLERKTIRRVEIQGMRDFKGHRVFTFIDHVEDVKLL